MHTGQHFDENMSDVFFHELDIPSPVYQLDIHGGNHGEMTGRMLTEIEKIIVATQPDYLMVYGDTNSTLAGALAAAKLHIPVVHVESGLRSFNMNMPEEINRILTDQISQILFCPTQTSVDNLGREGFNFKPVEINLVGDVMQDSAILFSEYSRAPIGLELCSDFILATLHRAENTDSFERLEQIVNALNEVHYNVAPVILPLHPRTRLAIQRSGLDLKARVINPVGYLEMLWLLSQCSLVLTDSGGTQKEAFFFSKPCVTMRDQTEWIELIDSGVNVLAGACKEGIINAVNNMMQKHMFFDASFYGGGKAAERIADCFWRKKDDF